MTVIRVMWSNKSGRDNAYKTGMSERGAFEEVERIETFAVPYVRQPDGFTWSRTAGTVTHYIQFTNEAGIGLPCAYFDKR